MTTPKAARYQALPPGFVQTAITAYREEIDEWIELNARQAGETCGRQVPGCRLTAKLLLQEMLTYQISRG